MATARRPSHRQHAAGAETTAQPKKATTFRLDPALKDGLEALGMALKKPLNRLVNEGLGVALPNRSDIVYVPDQS